MQSGSAAVTAKHVILVFLSGLSLYSIVGSAVFLSMGKEGAHLWFNSFHHPWADVFFRFFTETTNGIVPAVLVNILIFVRWSWALGMAASSISMGILVQWLKRGVFEWPRPAGFFEDGVLRTIEGLDRATQFSFPSGHSATAFCIFLMLALMVRRRWATYLFLGWAVAAAYSRVYLSQHFIEDTVAGAWIGVLTTMTAYHFIVRHAELHPHSWLNGRFWPSSKPRSNA